MFADVIVPLNLPQMLTYSVPAEMHDQLRPGMRVEVAIGKNKMYSAVVDSLHNFKPSDYAVKPIRAIIDREPIVNEAQLRFWRWISRYYLAAPGEVLQAALPAHLKLISETRLEWTAPENAEFRWSSAAYAAAYTLSLRKSMTISELKSIITGKSLPDVLNELLESGAVTINDSLESDYRPKIEKIVRLAPQYQDGNNLQSLIKDMDKAPKQQAVVMACAQMAHQQGFVLQSALMERTKATSAQVKILADKGIFVIAEQNVDRVLVASVENVKDIKLTPPQQKALHDLDHGLEQKQVALLHGVTGSGKTLIYINKIREYLEAGQQAIYLVPEIALTTQLVSRLHAYFGDTLGVYHSHFSNNERVEIWEKVRKGQFRIVVGPRSALWLPWINPGLIVVDEEHDSSYKQKEPAPRFHARDAAIYLAGLFGAKVILGSATPSLESLYNVQQGKYAYASLKDRYLGVNMPAIEVVSSKSLETIKGTGIRMLTPELQTAIEGALKLKRQVILFQNKRGYAPFLMCTSCGWVPQCSNCSVALTYHKLTDKLHCHYCGERKIVISLCPACGGNRLVSKTFGTEKIEEEVHELFPKAQVARMDVDSMRGKNNMRELFGKLEKGKVDILVGTQMVVKGLDFPAVMLVGIISADSLLSFPDFRVNERAFQLMEQVSGRAGRADGAGRVLIQANNIKHPVLGWVQNHDVQAFYRHEIHYREKFHYPPFCRLIKIIFRHKDENLASEAGKLMAEELKKLSEIQVQGPAPALIQRVRDQYIFEIWLKCPKDTHTLEHLKTFLKTQKQLLQGKKGFSSVTIIYDVDPV